MIFPAPLQDIDRINRNSKTRVLEEPELRTLFIGLDLKSNELRQSNVKGKNPLKDKRVRQAMMHAIDVKLITSKVMRGHAVPADVIMAKDLNGYDPRLAGRPALDPAAAKKLLAEAGYPNGFSVGLDCPNDRYVNDEEVCVAVVAMLARIGIDAKLLAQNKNNHFKKMLGGNSDMFFFGWAAATTLDAHGYLKDIMHTPDGSRGTWNPGGYSNPRVDELEKLVAIEVDDKKRNELIYEAFKIHKEDIAHLPLHTQTLVWAVRKGVDVVLTPINVLWLRWVKVN
jgi:peptide/nickel transport system substrate-binding protein